MENQRISGLEPLAQPDCRILVLGTMPGEKSIESNQYYAHSSNQFRKLIFDTFGKAFKPSYLAFAELLSENKIALWNVLASCQRTTSADQRILHPVPNDLKGFVASHPAVKKICFESKKAAEFYSRFFEPFDGIEYAVLPSASARFARMPYAEKLAIYKSELLAVL